MSTTPSERDGPSIIDQIVQSPDLPLDVFLDRDPHSKPYTDDELRQLVVSERANRARINLKQEKARAKKQGVEE